MKSNKSIIKERLLFYIGLIFICGNLECWDSQHEPSKQSSEAALYSSVCPPSPCSAQTRLQPPRRRRPAASSPIIWKRRSPMRRKMLPKSTIAWNWWRSKAGQSKLRALWLTWLRLWETRPSILFSRRGRPHPKIQLRKRTRKERRNLTVISTSWQSTFWKRDRIKSCLLISSPVKAR